MHIDSTKAEEGVKLHPERRIDGIASRPTWPAVELGCRGPMAIKDGYNLNVNVGNHIQVCGVSLKYIYVGGLGTRLFQGTGNEPSEWAAL